MTGRLRYVLAACFALLFVLFPEADHQRIAFLQTKAWLTDTVIGEHFDAPSPLPPIQTVYNAVGTSAEVARERADELSRSYREWARGQSRAIDSTQPPLLLQVRVGRNGFRAGLAQSSGGSLTAPVEFELLHNVGDTPNPEGAYYPDRWSLAPAFLAIVIAVLFGKVIPALLLGCFAGAWLFVTTPHGAANHLAVDTIANKVLLDQFRLEIVGFVFFLFMCVGVMTRSGGIQGMVDVISRFARGPVSAQLSTWAIGILIFFDDYSNCIITGSTMRPLTDRCLVAREKLAYIVDATAAPIAGISIFSTWIAYEVSMFAPQLPEVTQPDGSAYSQTDGFAVFVQTLPLRFYCILTIFMVAMTIITRREFGSMRAAAQRAMREGQPLAHDATPLVSESLNKIAPPDGAPLRARNALIPVILLVITTIALIFWFGTSSLDTATAERPWFEQLSAILGGGESQRALCIAAALAFVTALLLALGQRILTFRDAMASALRSARALMFAIVILVLAWAIGEICKDVGTAQFLTAAFHGSFSPWLLPSIMFATSALVAFSTGTSYGTMALLLPNVVVLSHTMGEAAPELTGTALMLLTIGAVLEGSIFGDHCSPISDTTVLSSVASGSDHMHHVRTQAPYAVFVMLVSMVCGYIPCALLGPEAWPIAWLTGFAAIAIGLFVFGTKIEATPASSAPNE